MNFNIKNLITSFIFLLVTMISTGFKEDPKNVINDFSLRNVDGKMVSTADFNNAKGFIIIFTCNHCPFAKLYTHRMNLLNKKYSALNVPLLAINSMDTLVYEEEEFSRMKEKAKNEAFNFPYLQDGTQMVGKQFNAEHTPTAYVIWKENNQWKIKYKGAIDNNGENPQLAISFIGNAVDEMLKGKAVTNQETESFGCRIFYRE